MNLYTYTTPNIGDDIQSYVMAQFLLRQKPELSFTYHHRDRPSEISTGLSPLSCNPSIPDHSARTAL